MEVKFKYEPWKPEKDVLVHRQKTTIGYAVVQSAVKVTRLLTRKQEKGRPAGLAMDQVVEILGGCIEWARWYGLTPEELGQLVNASIGRSKDNPRQKVLSAVQKFRGYRDATNGQGLQETRNLPR